MKKKLYLSCPYSHEDESVKDVRYQLVTQRAAELMPQFVVFSPITHGHPIAQVGSLPHAWEFWREQDFPYIDWCDVFAVYCLDGWKESFGVQAELKYAQGLGKIIRFIKH